MTVHRVVLSEDIDKHERSKEIAGVQFYTKQRGRRGEGRGGEGRRDVAF